MINVFIDGAEGTTGLQIRERMESHPHVRLMEIDPGLRKDAAARAEMLNACDFAILCLPDAAAIEAVSLVSNPAVRIIDASTAHRTAEGWIYGIPELGAEQRQRLAAATRLTNPGCHATGFVMLARPLVEAGIITSGCPLSATSVTGYSGGGKKMIAEFESAGRNPMWTARPYALGQAHKHLPEMVKHALLTVPPVFMPILCDYYQGMAVSIPLAPAMMAQKLTARELADFYAQKYAGCPCVKAAPYGDGSPEGGYGDPQEFNGTNLIEIAVYGNDESIVLMARFDNLGKGASGAAVQNLNIMAGFDETTALI